MKNISVVEQDSNVLPAGKYYVGDLCYLLPERIYEQYVCDSGKEEAVVEITAPRRLPFLAFYNHTAYGDGIYRDNFKNQYGVDAGLIGVVQLTSESLLKKAQTLDKRKNGKVIDFPQPFEVDASNGVFEFGHIRINTDFE